MGVPLFHQHAIGTVANVCVNAVEYSLNGEDWQQVIHLVDYPSGSALSLGAQKSATLVDALIKAREYLNARAQLRNPQQGDEVTG